MDRRRNLLGWIALGLSTALACFWAFWGVMENFHEGWWMPSLGLRLLWTLAYLGPMLICMGLGLIGLRWPRLGAAAWILLGLVFSFFVFNRMADAVSPGVILSWLPLTLPLFAIGLLWFCGRPLPLKVAYRLAIGLPLLVALAFGLEPAIRVSQRTDDGLRGLRLVQGNGVSLIWAPAGPGWVVDAQHACTWQEAQVICSHLSADGTRLEAEPQNIWRLPTVEEASASLTRGGRNAGGTWDGIAKGASYQTKPDKESPLWVVYAETIYWWTASEDGPERAFRIAFNGEVLSMPKERSMGTMGFRAVREP